MQELSFLYILHTLHPILLRQLEVYKVRRNMFVTIVTDKYASWPNFVHMYGRGGINCPFCLEGLDEQEVINTDKWQDLYNVFL